MIELVCFDTVIVASDISYRVSLRVNVGAIGDVENAGWGVYINTRLVEVIESTSETGVYTITPTFGI